MTPAPLTVGGVTFRNAGGAVNGPIDMGDALQVSSDVYFYRLGLAAGASGEHGPIQDWARALRARAQNRDRPAEREPGLIPTPAWRNRIFERDRIPTSTGPGPRATTSTSRSARATSRSARCSSPRAYAALANGGTRGDSPPRRSDRGRRRPHREEDPPGAAGAVWTSPPLTRETILEGIRRAAMEPGGTSYSVFGGFPSRSRARPAPPSAGRGRDQSWYGAIAPYGRPEDRRGGHGRARRLWCRGGSAPGRARSRALLRARSGRRTRQVPRRARDRFGS